MEYPAPIVGHNDFAVVIEENIVCYQYIVNSLQ